MSRNILSPELMAPEVLSKIQAFHSEVVKEIEEAVVKNRIVVVGMAGNPFVKKVRKALAEKGVQFTYIEHGSYWAKWKERLAIKLWSGWPTFPQVFVEGKLVGGYNETKKLLEQGRL